MRIRDWSSDVCSSDLIDSLLNRGGIQSMMWTISLVLIALGFGGALEKTGCLEAIIVAIMTKIRSFAGIQTAAIGPSVATNLVAGDPSQIGRASCRERGCQYV